MGVIGTDYKPEVAWRTYIKEAVLISEETVENPAIYQVTVEPIDTNENSNPGATAALKEVNYNILDYVGHVYRIVEINVGSNYKRIKVSDDFRWGESPQNGQQAVLYKSAGEGYSPWVAVTYGTHLSRTAMNMAVGIDNSILWKTGEKIAFTNTSTPSLVNYQVNYKIPYGLTPKFLLIITIDGNTEYYNYQPPVLNYVDGLLDSVVWDLGIPYSGYILIYR